MKLTLIIKLIIIQCAFGQDSVSIGDQLIRDEKFEEAIDLFKQLGDKHSTKAIYKYKLGQAYYGALNATNNPFSQGFYATRMKNSYQKAVDLDENFHEARIGLINFFMNAPFIAGGSFSKARKHIGILKEFNQRSGYLLSAEIFIKEKDVEKAREEYLLLGEKGVIEPEDYYTIAFSYQSGEYWNEAFDYFEKAIEANTGRWQLVSKYQYARTSVFSKMNVDKGIRFLQEYVAGDLEDGMPQLSSAHWRMGMLQEIVGLMQEARASYEKSLEIDSTNNLAKESLKNLLKD